ncbi:MAG: DUF4276 family protein [Deltaproteobacteria bacterium]|nr:DUF4276 family protein [Deltaproteobacteria bacterium]MBW2016903.1 DUF4276 family protein [Deltaproteobacteria bacterium]MBW2127740.1 DUF4276 family protein [Deltaproteobacteria bacterium]MBW2304399.1 DUF4276 family protein [Deltaproteobacteria bacterium]
MKIYVEGGGDHAKLKRECRRAFSKFFEKAGFKGRMPRIVACGSRGSTYDDFCTAVGTATNEELPLLLVDSEAPVQSQHQRAGHFDPWGHLHALDCWEQPANSDDEQAHLMVQCMEAWFLADRQCLQNFFGNNYQSTALPGNPDIETVEKQQLFDALENSTHHTQKGEYRKGAHSFKILELLDPDKVFKKSPWAERLRVKLNKELSDY